MRCSKDLVTLTNGSFAGSHTILANGPILTAVLCQSASMKSSSMSEKKEKRSEQWSTSFESSRRLTLSSVDDERMVIGDTFQLGGGHLWIAITVPDGAQGRFVMVNLTTLRPYTADQTCVLYDGDHPFVHRDSVVHYMDAREWWIHGANGYDEHLAAGNVTPNAHLSN